MDGESIVPQYQGKWLSDLVYREERDGSLADIKGDRFSWFRLNYVRLASHVFPLGEQYEIRFDWMTSLFGDATRKAHVGCNWNRDGGT